MALPAVQPDERGDQERENEVAYDPTHILYRYYQTPNPVPLPVSCPVPICLSKAIPGTDTSGTAIAYATRRCAVLTWRMLLPEGGGGEGRRGLTRCEIKSDSAAAPTACTGSALKCL
eukprot:1349377-Rhodomonas_salina.3